jgi:hydrogenase small subunit
MACDGERQVKMQQYCPLTGEKMLTARRITEEVKVKIMNQELPKMNAIWLEATGCSGNIISFLNNDNPNAYEVLTSLVNLTFSNTLMGAEGEYAYEKFLETLDTEFILLVEGAVTAKDNGAYSIIANYQGRRISAYEAIRLAGERAKYVIAVGTCASYGGISAAIPNPSGSVDLTQVLDRSVIRLPCCPCHPDWIVGMIAHLLQFGEPQLDGENRPVIFYGVTIHDNCTRRGFFDSGYFATAFGQPGCMFRLGCRGPVTRTDCPRRKWNGYVNWPIGNSNCIGCAQHYFPDGMEPFVRY